MADNWTDSNANWDTGGDWSSGAPSTSTAANVSQGDPQVTSPISIASLTVSAEVDFSDAGSSTISGAVTDTGRLTVDNGNGNGGSSLNIGGTLTNSGSLVVGATNLSAATTVTVAGINNFINTSLGTIQLYGTVPPQQSGTFAATLDVTSAAGLGAAGEIVGGVYLTGDSVLEFASNEITTVAGSSELYLSGPSAFVADAGSTSSNSALTGLTSIAGNLTLYDIAPLTLSGALTVGAGQLHVDDGNGTGGSQLAINGALTNSGLVAIGTGNQSGTTGVNASSLTNLIGTTLGTIDLNGNVTSNNGGPFLTTLDIAAAVGFGAGAGVVVGNVNLSGNSVLEFSGGEITTVAGSSELTLSGSNAFVANASNTSANSALTGLATITGNATFYDIAPLTLSGALSVTGQLHVDDGNATGGSTVSITGALTNSGYVGIGTTNLTAATNITTAGITNFVGTTLGTIDIYGNTATNVPVPVSTTLDDTGAAGFGTTSVLTGSVNMIGGTNGHALLEFANGEITTIAVNSELTLNGPDAFVADATNTAANSALTGLTSIAGQLTLYNGATLTTSGALTDTGQLHVDDGNATGGSSLSITGALTNSGYLGLGTTNLSAATTLTASAINNSVGTTLGTINIYGNTSTSVPVPVSATLDIGSAAGFGTASVLTGSVNLIGDALGYASVEFTGGEIMTIAANSELTLSGPDAFVEDGASNSNSALTGLATITGALTLYNGAAVSTSGALSVAGQLHVDDGNDTGGSSLTINGALTNNGFTGIGTGNSPSNTVVTASGFNNGANATLNVLGNSGHSVGGQFTVNGTAVNDGNVNVETAGEMMVSGAYDQAAGTTSVAGTLSAASYDISGGTLEVVAGGTLNGSVSFTPTATSALLKVDSASGYSGTLGNFETGDEIDLAGVTYSSSTAPQWTENGSDTGGTLLLVNGGSTEATLNLSGQYSSANFSLSNDQNGTLISFKSTTPTPADFYGAGTSDLLFQDASGDYAMWQTNGSTVIGGGNVGSPGSGWTEIGTGDFNTGNKSDILFESSSASYALWDMNGTSVTNVATFGNPGAGFSFVDVGNFDGTGNGDILFENTGGDYAMWETNGTAVIGGGNVGSPGAGWSEVGIGDFNNDGKSDILFESTGGSYAIWDMNGTSVANVVTLGSPGAGWTLEGVGNFYGNGTNDLLFENTAGDYATWETNGNSVIGGANLGSPGAGWSFAAIGDYNGDGVSDILFQNGTGGSPTFAAWEMNAGTVANVATFGTPGAGWALQHTG
jgi:hypothetical protein